MTTIPATVQERISLPAVGAPLGAAAAGGMGLSDFTRMIKQRMALILTVWFLFIGLTVGGTYLAAKYFPLWGASSLLYVEERRGDDPLAQTRTPQTTDTVTRFLKDQAAFIKSQFVLERALVDVEVKKTGWYKSIANPDERIRDLEDELIVTPLEGTSLLQVTIYTHSPEDPHRIVNAVVTSYLYLFEEGSRSRYRAMIDDYARESDAARKAVSDKLKEIQDYLRQISQPGVVMGYNVLGEQIGKTSEVVADLQAQKQSYKALYDSYAMAGPDEMAVSPQTRQLVESDPQIVNLAYQLQALKQEKLVAASRFGPNHRQIKDLETRTREIEKELGRFRELRLLEIKQYQRDQTELAYLNAQAAELYMRDVYEGLLAQQRDLDRQISTYTALTEELRMLEEKARRLDDYLSQLKAWLNQSSMINVRRHVNATAPLERYFPNWFINVPVGTFLGLVIAVGLALLVELVNTSVRSPVDIVRHASMPVLGTVPDADDEEVDIEQIEKAVLEKPQSMIAEAFKIIRTNLFFSAPADRQRTLMTTSPHPEDGKTTVAANLATTIAQSARRVLLVDANFRRPALGQLYGTGNGVGLSNILIGQKKLAEVVRSTSVPNLDVLPSGPIPPNPAELLGGAFMHEFLAAAQERYDQVLFDTAPILLVSDALVLSSIVDGVILVARAQVSSRGVVNRARELLERVNARVFGAVLNAAQVRRGGYFREQLRTFYDYQPEPEELAGGLAPALPQGTSTADPDADDTDEHKPT